ncbi:metalloprotease [Daedaleopsis nitida]|nr:metalloprotease [Daedaleopsis nitida]
MSNELPCDPSTQSNWQKVASESVDFDWTVDFDQQTISGSATHTLRVKENGVTEVIFDTSALTITGACVDGQPGHYTWGQCHKVMGKPLHVCFPSPRNAGDEVSVQVFYSTTKDGIAMQWLDKQQTRGKTDPAMFSQCQPIYARSMAPLQDTSSVKITYTAKVASVLPALLSAIRISPPLDGPPHDGKEIGKDVVTYTYKQPVPIPTYLIAIAVGNFTYCEFPKYDDKKWSTGIWAEPETMDDAYQEFYEDIPKFLATAETMFPPYRFGVYDLLVLPPSFPYGGMENPCLTFLTPTLIVGDRSLVDVAVHELTHSWTGNGVTQANMTHFWLNEGWTVYMERVLLQTLHTPADRGLAFYIGYKGLQDALEDFIDIPRYQRLVIDFDYGEDPDLAYSEVPYEKGSNFLLHLETVLGGLDAFLPYVYDYVDTFMGQSITTEMWKDHLFVYWGKHGSAAQVQALQNVDWQGWLYGEGLTLPVDMRAQYDTSLADDAICLAKQWDALRSEPVSKLPFKSDDLKDYSANQKMVFLDALQTYKALPETHITHLGTLYALSASLNAELRWRFYMAALLDPTSSAARTYASPAVNWVVGKDGNEVVQGRMKFCRPTFVAVQKVDCKLAVDTYEDNKTYFHPIAQKLIEEDLGISSGAKRAAGHK